MSLTVVFGTRRFKIPVSSSTLLSQVRDQVCEALKLPTSDYGLSRQSKHIDLTLPFRFANLVNNAQLDLVKTPQAEIIRVKVRVPGTQDFVGKFSREATVQTVLNESGLKGQLLLNNVVAQPNTRLSSLGGTGGILFTLKPEENDQKKNITQNQQQHQQQQQQQPNKTTKAGEQSLINEKNSTKETGISNESQKYREPVVTTSASISPPNREAASSSEDPPEMDSRQFLTYYQHLKQQSEPPMLSKSTQAKLRSENKPPIESTTIRIKFPDQNTLEGKFTNGEHGKDVYDFVKMYLQRPDDKFELVSMKPHFTLQPDAHLVNDCQFGTRAVVVFKSDQKKDFLNQRARAIAKTPEQHAFKSQEEDEQHKAAKNSKTSLKSKMTPKWLKLHK